MKGLEESSGKAAEGEQIVRMNNERFMVPEVTRDSLHITRHSQAAVPLYSSLSARGLPFP